MKVLFVAGREASYSRSRNVMKGLELSGVDVVGCFPPGKSFRHYLSLIWRAVWLARHCDVIIVGFYGQVILPFIKLLTWKPILFDMYISTYDTMIYDRSAARPRSLAALFYYCSDWLALKLSRYVILETQDHIENFAAKFHTPIGKFKRIFLATDSSVLYPRKMEKSDKFLVHFHGEYAPFHGVRYIIEAAHLLRNEGVEFQIIGTGITYKSDRTLAEKLNIRNIRFIERVSFEELADYMGRADVCLGIFGDNRRMLRVLTNKVIEAIAVARPLITGRNDPVQELLKHGESVYLVERGSARAIADAILKFKSDPVLAETLATNGYEVFLKNCTCEILGRGFKELLEAMVRNDERKR